MANIYTAVEWAKQIANDNTHGYDQANRQGPDYDCSSLVANALHNGGFNISPDSWTGNLYSQLIAEGFTSIPINASRKLGDIFLNEQHHVIMCINENEIVQASINENGGVTGGQTGDQTGHEIYITNYYAYSQGWDYHLRPPESSYISSNSQWHAKATGGYAKETTEALDNVSQIALLLIDKGWTIEAIAAMLGCGAGESGLNPWRWEGDIVPTVNQAYNWTSEEMYTHGYGLFQFTPFFKYVDNAQSYPGYAPNFADRPGQPSDGEAQTLFMNDQIDTSWSHDLYGYYEDDFSAIGVDISTFYYMTPEEFKDGQSTIPELVGAFELCYLRPADYAAAGSYNFRVSQAEYWYEILKTMPIPGKTRKFNIYLYLKPKWKRGVL